MKSIRHTLTAFEKRKLRVRSKISGTTARPRLTVFRSNKYIYLQVINDETGTVLASANDKSVQKAGKKEVTTKTQGSVLAATQLAQDLKKQNIKALVMDRGAYKYHGRVKAVAETLREQGVQL